MDIEFWPQNIQMCDLDFTDEEMAVIDEMLFCWIEWNNSLFAKTKNWRLTKCEALNDEATIFVATFELFIPTRIIKRKNINFITFRKTDNKMTLIGKFMDGGNFWAMLPEK
jgi:hypothetical protein